MHRVKESAHLLPHVTHDVAHALASNQLQSVHLRGDVVGVWSTMNTASIIEHARDYLHLHPIDRLESERAAAVMLNERGSFGLVHLCTRTYTHAHTHNTHTHTHTETGRQAGRHWAQGIIRVIPQCLGKQKTNSV